MCQHTSIPVAVADLSSAAELMHAVMHTGVIRDSTCMFMSTWQAYKCFGMNYRMLVIESLDSDTETRRLSPVAVLGDGYVDLLNGKHMSASVVTKYIHIMMNRSDANSIGGTLIVFLSKVYLKVSQGIWFRLDFYD